MSFNKKQLLLWCRNWTRISSKRELTTNPQEQIKLLCIFVLIPYIYYISLPCDFFFKYRVLLTHNSSLYMTPMHQLPESILLAAILPVDSNGLCAFQVKFPRVRIWLTYFTCLQQNKSPAAIKSIYWRYFSYHQLSFPLI